MSVKSDPKYYRASLGLKAEIRSEVDADYCSAIVDWLRQNGYRLDHPSGLSIQLAREFGFCYGVDKAVDMAYEARAKFPDKRIFLTYEIIHNPRVNQRLLEMGIEFLSGALKSGKTLEDVTADDVVLMPAFGVPVPMMEKLRARGCILVDTTCGSVVHVWKRVEKYAKDGFTALVHGKAIHAETLATISQAQKLGGKTIIVRDKEETDLVCDVIRGKRPAEDLRKLGEFSLSPGFDIHADLDRIGVANQTTMLASESLEIGAMVREALVDRHGADAIEQHFRSFDTICSATQERQDAVMAMLDSGELDMMLIIGGYNSSNTGHLLEIAADRMPAYHISDANELISASEIHHKPAGEKDAVAAHDWLPPLPCTIGLTAGASTPNRAIGEVIARLAELYGVEIKVTEPATG